MTRIEIFFAIGKERNRQDDLHGEQKDVRLNRWMLILGEEFGECCKELCDNPRLTPKLRDELIQVAAVCVKILEVRGEQKVELDAGVDWMQERSDIPNDDGGGVGREESRDGKRQYGDRFRGQCPGGR